MTSTSISQTMFFSQPVVNRTEAGSVSDGQFKQTLEKQTAPEGNAKKPGRIDNTASTDKATANVEYTRNSKAAQRISDTGMNQEEKPNIDQIDSEIQELLANVMAYLTQIFDVTEADIESAMSSLDMKPEELLEQTKLTKLVSEICNVENPMELLTDEELYGKLKDVQDFAADGLNKVKNEFKLSDTEIGELLNRQMKSTEDLPADKNVIYPEGDKNIKNEVFKSATAENVKTDGYSEGIDSVEETVAETDRPYKDYQSDNSENKNTFTNQNRTDKTALKQTQHSTDKPDVQVDFKQQFDPLNRILSADSTATVRTDRISAEDIMRQIMDYMKITVKHDSQDLEMQLHPQSLGNVQIHIGNKEGAVTAQFTTENEAVKATLESQLVQLKERFEEQGIKVETIEVTVATHSFDQNLGRNEQDSSGQFEAQARKTGRSILHAAMSDEETELLDEEDKLNLSMMEANGNQVDYKA